MQNAYIINLKECISTNLSLRVYAEDLFKDIKLCKQDNIIIDFNEVEFASRSFTQEFLYRMKHCSKELKLINQPNEVKKMFEIVRSPREKAVIVDYNPERIINIAL